MEAKLQIRVPAAYRRRPTSMQRVLNQEEIDAIVQATRGLTSSGPKAEKSVQSCDFRQAGQLSREIAQAVSGMYEAFARNLSQALGLYLPLTIQALLVSVEQLTYRDFLVRSPEVTYMISFRMRQLHATAAMQIDNSIVFPLIDVLLGGNGKCEMFTREVTQIEEKLMQEVTAIICRGLEGTWQMLGVEMELETRKQPAEMQRLMPAWEKVLALSFEMKMNDAHGMLNIIFPAAASSALFRKLSSDLSCTDKPPTSGQRLREGVLDCQFQVEMGIPRIKTDLVKLLELAPGEIFNLRLPLNTPGAMLVGGRELFEAHPVRCGHRRAARIGQSLQPKLEMQQ
jgi:flagellar motor switch protein FliM